jgi:DNA polymerase-3 subunit alpha
MPEFVHLHSHTQFSLLDGASNIGVLMKKAAADGMKGAALTDHGNMFGAFKFVAEAEKNGIKPIIGCEFYLVKDRFKRSFAKASGERDRRYHQLLLAKNAKGYQNLCKLCSAGFIDGLYGKFPRIDKTLIEKHHEGLIATSCCVGAEIPQAIIEKDHAKAEELLKWWLNIFGEDFYIEIQRHRGLEDLDVFVDGKPTFSGVSQEDVNQVLLGFAKKYNIKVIATNDAHYVEEEDATAHDMLLCINTGSLVSNPDRFKFSSSDFYFKSQAEMNSIFTDVPESIDNTMEVFDKIEKLTLARDILLPAFPLPPQFKTQDEYLRFLTYEGAKERYGAILDENTISRLDFELDVIRNSGYPGYFLIVQDFTTEARTMGVSVGPGRGSAAGSAVAYCLGITNVDPIKYDLLFERFLNPERVSMPDIDIDFDDVGRQKVIDYVIDKYGRNQVAQIITYGSMAAKTSLQDVGRVMDIPLDQVIATKKAFPENMSATLKKVLQDDGINAKLKGKMDGEDLQKAENFRDMAAEDSEIGTMIRNARKLEGSIRNTGIHACGVVITPDDITNYIPVTVAKDSDLLVSQFDNSVAEDAGLLKMDFLGLKTLTIIKDACKIIKAKHGVEIIPDEVPLDDPKTYELFQAGQTVGIFQYESPGMQKYMRELVPTKFADLIAMNALYRPGPIAYIPEFIDRKHGRKPITYDLDDMEEYLAESYGITVYQEQVMLLSQKLANFSKGEADVLRKAMGKKKMDVLMKMKPKFLDAGEGNGHDREILEKVWKDWEAFASYAFNKSHSTCYAFVAFQTAYLKAHYPAEFMASVLTHNKNDISKVQFFLEECRAIGVDVLGPDVNESYMNFSVNQNGAIRFGMSAVKGVGEGAVEAFLEAKKEGGPFQDIFDIVKRISPGNANKKCFESLVLGGGLDEFGLTRATYFAPMIDGKGNFLEAVLKFGSAYQKQKSDMTFSLFGAGGIDETMPLPKIPQGIEEWGLMEKLKREKEVTGIYLSGHPLDDYKFELRKLTKTIAKLDEFKDQEVAIGAIVVSANHRVSKKGSQFAFVTVEDHEGKTMDLGIFANNYLLYSHLLVNDQVLYIKGKYQKSWRDETQYELRITEISLLEEIGNQKIKGIAINLPIQMLTPQLIDQLDKICEKYKGEQSFSVNLLDVKNKIKLELDSNNRRINADSLFINELEMLNLKYTMIS